MIRKKVVLHAHSTWSYDGKWTLEKIARTFGALGVDAVMMTEHDTGFEPERFSEYRAACAAASTRRCTLIPGIEYSSPDNDIHLLTWGLSDFLAEHRPVSETLAAVREAGGVCVFAHPVRREAWKKFEPEWTNSLAAIELWNRKSDGIAPGPEALELLRRTGLPAVVGPDFHKLRHFWPLTNQVAILPGTDLESGLVDALAKGQMRPQAFGRPLVDEAGKVRTGFHPTLEKGRRALRDLVRGSSK